MPTIAGTINLAQLLPQGLGDDMLHFNGPGEILIWADWTDGDIAPDGKVGGQVVHAATPFAELESRAGR